MKFFGKYFTLLSLIVVNFVVFFVFNDFIELRNPKDIMLIYLLAIGCFVLGGVSVLVSKRYETKPEPKDDPSNGYKA
jgi:uncharacterized membrane-anchored protein YitT (DUF2179 family)